MNNNMKREVIFEVPNMDEYRIVCRFGYSHTLPYVWWCHIEKKIYYKKWKFFGEKKYKWYEVDRCWWTKDIKSMDCLKKYSLDFFDDRVLLIPRIIKEAMEI
jgi:hypothetical protein